MCDGIEPKTKKQRKDLGLAPKPMERIVGLAWAIYFALIAIAVTYLSIK